MALSATPHDEMKGAMLFRILKFKINLGTTDNFAILPQIFYNNDVRNQILHIKLSTFVLIKWKPGAGFNQESMVKIWLNSYKNHWWLNGG